MSDELSNNWKEMTDKKSGRKFYYNTVTKKTQWTLPTKEIDSNDTSQTTTTVASSSSTTKSSSSDWKEMTDKKSGKNFYYNVKTKKTQWTKPDIDVTQNNNNDNNHSTTTTVASSNDNDNNSNTTASSKTASDWTARTDPSTNRVYYFNKRTNKTQWDEPEELKATNMTTQLNKNTTSSVVDTTVKTKDNDNTKTSSSSSSDWKEMTDKKSGRAFYYNTKTKKTQWTKPAGDSDNSVKEDKKKSKTSTVDTTITSDTPQKKEPVPSTSSSTSSPWIEKTDPNSGRAFYYNKVTKKTQWEKPDDFKNSKIDESATSSVKKKKKKKDKSKSKTSEGENGKNDDWKEMTDKTSGRVFYYNKKTKETQWTKPTTSDDTANVSSSNIAKNIDTDAETKDLINKLDDSINNNNNNNNNKNELKPETSAKDTKATKNISSGSSNSSEWKEMKDKKSGRTFYYNKKTKKTQWTKPVENNDDKEKDQVDTKKRPTQKMRKRSTVIQSMKNNWQEMKDPKSGKTFYYNKITGESAWNIPKQASAATTAVSSDSKSEAVTTTITDDYNNKVKGNDKPEDTSKSSTSSSSTKKDKKKKKDKSKSKSKSKRSKGEKWKIKKDAKGRTYYVNIETRKSQWTIPDDLKVQDENTEETKSNKLSTVIEQAEVSVLASKTNEKVDIIENTRSKAISYQYDKNLIVKGGHLQRKTSHGIWRTEFVNLTKDVFVLSQTGEWEDTNLLKLPLIEITSVELQQHEETKDGKYNSGFIISFNVGACEGMPKDTNEIRVKCKNDEESMEWVTMIDAQQDMAKDAHVKRMKEMGIINDEGKGVNDISLDFNDGEENMEKKLNEKQKKSMVTLSPSHVALLDFLKSKNLMNNLNTFPTDDKLIEIERNIEKIEDRNHRLLKQVLWMEWREKHGLPRNTSSSSAEIDSQKNDSTDDDSEKRRNALVRRRLMLSQYTKFIDLLRREPAVVAAVGCSLPEKAQGEFANLVANHIFSSQTILDYSKSFEKVIDAAIRQHSEAQTLLGSMNSSSQQQTNNILSNINNRNKSNRYDHFLLCLIQNQAQTRDSITFTKAVIHQIDFNGLMKSTNNISKPRNSIVSPTKLFSSRNGNYNNNNNNAVNISSNMANDMSPSLHGALLLIDAMCNTVLEDTVSMPRSIFSVCQSLSDHPGPISAMDFLFDTMLCRELEIEAKYKLSNSVGGETNKKIGRLLSDVCVHIRTIISKTKWKKMSLKYKATISKTQARLNAFVQRLVQIDPAVFDIENDHAVYGQVLQERIVLSCFQLYLLHMSVHRFVNMPHSFPQPRMETLDLLSQLGKPIPLPGTEKWGSSENPFTVLILSKKAAVAASQKESSSSAIVITSSDENNMDMPEFLMTPKRVQRNFSTANIAIKNCKEYIDSKTVTDHSKNILLGLEATVDDVELKIKTENWLKETLNKSKSVSLAIEDVLKSSSSSGIKLVDTLSARSPARSKFISLGNNNDSKKGLNNTSSSSKLRMMTNSPKRQQLIMSSRDSINTTLSSPIQTLMSTVFSPLHLRSDMQGVNGANRFHNSMNNSGSTQKTTRSFDLF